MPGIVLVLGTAALVVAGAWVRQISPVISNAAFMLAAVLVALALLAFGGWI